MSVHRQDLSHIFFIGGATDAGKSTVTNLLADRHGFQTYHYDQTDVPHHQRLAQADAEIQGFMKASLDENWVFPTPQELMRRALHSFELRFPLVIEELLALPQHPPILAEGFGFTPSLLQSVLANPRKAIWFIPTAQFKRESMDRRGKPSFVSRVSDPQRAKQNLFERDMLLADYIEQQARQFNFRVIVVDGSQMPDELADAIEQYFGLD